MKEESGWGVDASLLLELPVWCCFACDFDDCGDSDSTVNNVDVDHGADGDPGAWPDSEDRVSWLGEGWLWMPYDGMW